MDNATEFVVHERPCVDTYQRLNRRAKVVRGEVGAVGQLDVDQRVDRNRRVRCNLDKGVEGKSKPVVQFVGQILKQAGIVDCNVQGKIRTVNAASLGCRCYQRSTLEITNERGLYLLSIFRTGGRVSLYGAK